MQNIAYCIEQYIRKHNLMNERETYLTGLSGGADSVALTCILHQLGYRIEVVHCNFKLRGYESNRDEDFCKAFARELNIPIHITHFDTVGYASSHKVSIEMAARDLRYRFFEQTRKETGAAGICVAHHKDDQVETVLLHLVRGTGLDGLLGMKPQNGFIIRPLLHVSRHEILNYLEQTGQSYVTDSTNLVADVQRNKLRLNVIPLLENINASFKEHVIRMTEHLEEVNRVVDNAFVHDNKSCKVKAGTYNLHKIKQLVSPSLFLWKLLSGKEFNRNQITEMLEYHEGTATWYTTEYVVVISRNTLQVLNRTEWEASLNPVEVTGVGQYKAGNKLFTFDECDITPLFIVPKAREMACVNREKINFPLIIRRLKEGDYFMPFGMKGTKLVSNYLKDIKCSPQQRREQLVVTDMDGHIIWLAGHRIDDRYRLNIDGDHRALFIKYSDVED